MSKPWFWVAAFVAAVAVVVLGVMLTSLIIRAVKREEAVPVTEPTIMTEMNMTVNPDIPAVMEGGLVVKEQGSYSGFFMEDGSNQMVTDVMMMVVENQSGRDLQLADIYVKYADFEAFFQVTNLPAGKSAMLLEKNAHKVVEEISENIRMENMVYFQEPMSLKTDMFEYSLSDGVIQVTNKSDQNISGDIYVYHKYLKDDLYRGGITFRAKIEGGLQAGQTKEVSVKYFYIGFSNLMAITYAG